MNNARDGSTLGPKPTKACVNCRRQKMKCEIDRDEDPNSCRRCRLSKTECIFKPRANAAILQEVPSPRRNVENQGSNPNSPGLDASNILNRLEAIEAYLGFSVPSLKPALQDDVALRLPDTELPFHGVWTAAAHLKATTRPPQNFKIWSREVIKQLWLSFHKNMPGLHFLSKKKTSATPTPLLLAAILYVSALHHSSPEFAALAPGYFVATCGAISELAVPVQVTSRGNQSPSIKRNAAVNDEEKAFENVLGLILAGLISEAFIETTGLWISMGYRLTLDHCPVQIDERSNEWRGLFSGLQIIDLEHASLHMSCPILPKQAPLPSLLQLQTSTSDPFYSLTQMMHSGLSHFTGRGLPTIWSFISSNQIETGARSSSDFTETDGRVVREWAKQLDDWLVQWNRPSDNEHDSLMIFRQYCLHRLFVLSIYHPARGFDLFANNVASIERQELLISARATLKLQNQDKGIWSNWDLVMITWAALLVLQGVEGGVGEADDFLLIQAHLNMLQSTHQPEPSLRHRLASRLEACLQAMHTPPAPPDQDVMLSEAGFDSSWAIFDQNSIPIASQSLLLERQQLGSNSAIADGRQGSGIAGQYDAPAMMRDPHAFEVDGQWFGNEQYTDAWQSTILRLFGNVDSVQE